MEYLSTILADRMCKHEIIREDDKKYYAYSIQLLLEKAIGILLIGIFAFVFKSVIEIAVFLVTFSLIRIHSDGIHCKTSIGCFVSSVLLTLSAIPVTSFISSYPVVTFAVVLLSAVVIFVIGTIRDPNLGLTEQEFVVLRKRSRIGILIIGTAVLALLFLFPANHYVYYSALGIIYNALSLIGVKILKAEDTQNDKERV